MVSLLFGKKQYQYHAATVDTTTIPCSDVLVVGALVSDGAGDVYW